MVSMGAVSYRLDLFLTVDMVSNSNPPGGMVLAVNEKINDKKITEWGYLSEIFNCNYQNTFTHLK